MLPKSKNLLGNLPLHSYSMHEEDQVHSILNDLDYNYDMVLAIVQSKIEPIIVRQFSSLTSQW